MSSSTTPASGKRSSSAEPIETPVAFETTAESSVPFYDANATNQAVSGDAHAPIIAFVNFKSGGKKGNDLVRLLQAELGRDMVFNLAVVNPLKVIDEHRSVAGLRVVACGGDGTVNWVLSSIAKLNMNPQPMVGIIPLGTGNDTSRHFGWSHKLRDARTVVSYIRRMRSANCPTRKFDRWNLLFSFPLKGGADAEATTQNSLHPFLRRMPRIPASEYHSTLAAAGLTANSHASGSKSPSAAAAAAGDLAVSVEGGAAAAAESGNENDGELHLVWSYNNYFSFGIDAEIMDSFHRHRESSPGCYCCRCCNMVWVGIMSPLNCCKCNERPLRLQLDYLTSAATSEAGSAAESATGEQQGPMSWSPANDVRPTDHKALVFLNLPTYAGGRDIFDRETAECKPSDAMTEVVTPESNDGLVEVLGFDGYLHMSATVMRLGSRATRLGQVPGARIQVGGHVFAQLDGEAWEMENGRIELVRAPSVTMLVNEPGDVQSACCDC